MKWKKPEFIKSKNGIEESFKRNFFTTKFCNDLHILLTIKYIFILMKK